MAEFNPYKLEEEKWTPSNVYEILPPNAVSWSDYDFGQGTDNVDRDAAEKSFIDGFVDFFKDLFGVAGQILGGALELGGAILGGFVEGVANFIGGIANAIGSIFGGGPTESPYPPMFSPIKANLEAAIQPFQERIDESLDKSRDLLAEQLVIREQISEQVEITRAAVADAKAASERAGVAIGEAEAAVAAAEDARQQLEDYNTRLNERITTEFNAAVGRANTAVDKADSLAQQLEDFKIQASADVEDALSKAQAANDELAALSPQIDEAVSNSSAAIDKADQTLADYTAWAKTQKTRIDSAVSKAEAATANVATLTPQVADAVAKSVTATDNVATLTPKVTDAVTKAGAAVTKADAVTSAYNTFKTEQQARIDSAVSKAEKASSDVSTLTPKVTDAVSKSNKAAADVSTLTPKVDDAAAKAAKASTDVSALSPKVDDAAAKANKATSDLSTLTPKVTAAQTRADNAFTEAGKVRDEVTPKINAAQTKGESALAVADRAIDWLSNPVDIGTSLLANIPGTETPAWIGRDGVHEIPKDDLPAGAYNGWYSDNVSAQSLPKLKISINPAFEYKVTGWAKREAIESEDPSAFLLHIRSDEDSNPIDVYDRKKGPGTWWSHNAYILSYRTTATEWEPFEVSITFKEYISKVWLSGVTWSYSSGSHAQAKNYVAGLRIEPAIPTQASVDQAQNDAIRANSEILRQQDEINEAQRVANLANNAFIDNQTKWNLASTNATQALADADKAQKDINAEQAKFNTFQTDFNTKQTKWNAAVDRSLATQKTVNDNFKKWSDGAATAIEANTTAIKALTKPEIGSSLIALDADTREPHYMQWAGQRTAPSSDVPFSYAVRNTSSGETRADAPGGQKVPVKLNSDLTYKWSVWIYSNKSNAEIRFLTTSDSIGLCVEKTTYKHTKKSNTSKWGIFVDAISTGWSKYEGTIKFLPGTDNVHLYGVEWNKTSIPSAQLWFSQLDIVPDVPTQAQVDAAQNKALEAHDLLFKKQDEWNAGTTAALEAQKTVDDNFKKWTEGATTAIEANTRALAIINSSKQGNNIIPVNPDSGRPWFAEPLKESTDHPPLTSGPTYYSPAAQTAVTTYGPYVEVDPKIKYTVSFWAKASKAGSVFYGQFRSQEGRTVTPQGEPLTKGGVTVANPPQPSNKDSNGNYVHNAAKSSYFVSNLKLNTTWTYYETEIQFNEGVTAVSILRLYWSHSNGVKADQYISGLSIRPQIPTQAQVDDAQNKAIESLGILTAKQKEWSDGAEKAIQANTDVATALARINGIQVGGRNLLKKSYLNVSNNSYPTARADFGDSVPANGEEVTISVKGSLGAGKTSFAFYNSGSSTQVASVPASERDSNGVYKVVTKWKSNSSNSYVNIYPMPRSATSTSTVEWIKLERGNQASDWTPAPEDLPTQKQVDDAQNDAISANTEALKALGKKSLGVSLVPYKTPSTKEVEDYGAGKLSYDPWAEPEYYDAGDRIGNTSRGRAPGSTVERSVQFQGTPVTVDAKIGYRVKFTTYAAVSGTRIFWYMYNQNNNNCLDFTPFADTATTGGRGLIHGLTLPVGWKTWEGVVTFTSETEEVKLWTLFWNHPAGATGSQYIKDLSIVPEVPSQAAVDELQNNAIRKNTEVGSENKKAIDALAEGLDAYVAAAELMEVRDAINAELEEQSLAREDLEKKLNEAIVESVPRMIIYDSGKPQFNDHFESLERTQVVAKKGWVGQMVLDVTWKNGDKVYRDINTYPVPGTNDNRVYNVPSASFGSAQPAYRIDYWVYRGKSVQHPLSNSGAYLTGSTHKGNTWTQIATHTVKKTNGVVYFRWTTKLKKADRGRTYYFDVRVNGTSVIPKSFKGYGPMTSLGDGRATLTFSGTLNVPDNGKITVHTKSTGNATQAGVSSNKGMVSYLELE